MLECVRVYPTEKSVGDAVVGTMWDLPCEVPFCVLLRRFHELERMRGPAEVHQMGRCPIMYTAVVSYGTLKGCVEPLETAMRGSGKRVVSCLACECGKGMVDEKLVQWRCAHCLNLCYCVSRTFEEVRVKTDEWGVRLVKASEMGDRISRSPWY